MEDILGDPDIKNIVSSLKTPFEISEQPKARCQGDINPALHRKDDSHPRGSRCAQWRMKPDLIGHLLSTQPFKRTLVPLRFAITLSAEGISGGILLKWAVSIDCKCVVEYSASSTVKTASQIIDTLDSEGLFTEASLSSGRLSVSVLAGSFKEDKNKSI